MITSDEKLIAYNNVERENFNVKRNNSPLTNSKAPEESDVYLVCLKEHCVL